MNPDPELKSETIIKSKPRVKYLDSDIRFFLPKQNSGLKSASGKYWEPYLEQDDDE